MSSVVSQATLLVIRGADQGARFELDGSEAGIGRGVHNRIRLLDTEVSRQHAQFVLKKGRYHIVDRGSSNGTFVNGKPAKSAMLRHGDRIRMGRSVLLFGFVADPEAARLAEQSVDLVGRRDDASRSSITARISPGSGSSLLKSPATSRELDTLQVLYRVLELAAGPVVDDGQLLRDVLELTIQTVRADRGCILLVDAETGELRPHVFLSVAVEEGAAPMPISRSITDLVLRQREGVRTTDARADSRFGAAPSVLQAGIREAMCVPLEANEELLGVIYLDTTKNAGDLMERENASHFRESDLRLLVAIGRQAALVIETRRYQQAFLKAERLAAMGQTIAMLSHHIKNILQGVRGGGYLIDRGLESEDLDRIEQGWKIVERNQGRIYHLVMDMLSFSKDRQPALELGSLPKTVTEICDLMRMRAIESDVTLECRVDESIPETLFDPEGLHRAILNIVINALDAVEDREEGTVVVRCGYEPATTTYFITITDNGPGIPDEQLAHIFQIFESSKGSRGTGLGLAVSQKILREHGGEIKVESRIGEGSRFLLSWPKIEEDRPRLDRPTGEEDRGL